MLKFVKACSDILRLEYSPHEYHKIILPFLCGEDSTILKEEIKTEIKSLISIYNVETLDLGDLFECFLTYFAETTSAEFYTPEDIRKLTIDLLNINEPNSIYDPTCGTGGFLSTARHKYPNALLFGQELSPDTSKIARLYLGENIKCGNTLTEDKFEGLNFDLILANPPFGLDWKRYEKIVKSDIRFQIGCPRISDGSMLFLLHCISKLSDNGKLGIVLNASPLFTGDAGSGESEIRRWIIENDLLEAIIALPDQLFYNTGISTYIWILSNSKSDLRKSKIRLVNGISYFEKMRKSLGNKRNLISNKNREDIVKLYSTIEPHEDYIDFDNADFGYHKITINSKTNGKDTERVPLKEDIKEYLAREVLPHIPDAQIDEKKTKVGYEIPFTRYFYKFTPLRKSEDILAEIQELQNKINENFYLLMGRCFFMSCFSNGTDIIERKMKDSGIPWIGQIPEDWEVTKVKYLFHIGRGRVISKEELVDNGLYPVYSSQTKDNGCLGYINTYDFDCNQITWTTDGANAGTVFLRKGKHNCTNVCGTLQLQNKDNNLLFLSYLLDHIGSYYKRPDTNGAKIMNNEMAEIILCLSPFSTQQAIANYLDLKTSQVDSIIEYQKKLIELLKEYRKSVISEAVTGKVY